MSLSYSCRICNYNLNDEVYHPKEMMYGLRQSFTYFKCKSCGCLQISEYPNNVEKYYSDGYHLNTNKRFINKLKDFLLLKRDKFEMTGKGLLGYLVSIIIPQPGFRFVYKFLEDKKSSKILDVGCSTGRFLLSLRRLKFEKLFGIDPYISSNLSIDGIEIIKGNLTDIDDTFDVLILNHSLEHMPDQINTFKNIYDLLSPGGFCLLRIPLSSSLAFEKYKENWVQLDAPRHYYLHSIDSIKILSKKVGFNIIDVIFDSTSFQFWGSENYLKNISTKNKKITTFICNLLNIRQLYNKFYTYKKLSYDLNAKANGDQAIFFLYKS